MSRPVSMIVVQTRTSKRFSQKSTTTCSSRCSAIWPWAVATRASGTSSRILALAQQLAPDGGDDLLLVIGPDEGQNGVALLGRRGKGGHLTDSGDSHLQGARDRSRRQRKNVHGRAQPFELLFVLDTEALLLVDHHQPEVLE